jgi:hypothetical protein
MRFVLLDRAGILKAEIMSATAAPKEDSRISLGWQTAKKQAMFKSSYGNNIMTSDLEKSLQASQRLIAHVES